MKKTYIAMLLILLILLVSGCTKTHTNATDKTTKDDSSLDLDLPNMSDDLNLDDLEDDITSDDLELLDF